MILTWVGMQLLLLFILNDGGVVSCRLSISDQVPDHVSLWELLLPMRQIFQQYGVCLYPSPHIPLFLQQHQSTTCWAWEVSLHSSTCLANSTLVNCRPVTLLPGIKAPINTVPASSSLDWVIVRENSEGEYSGQGGRSHKGTVGETATEVGIFTRCMFKFHSLLTYTQYSSSSFSSISNPSLSHSTFISSFSRIHSFSSIPFWDWPMYFGHPMSI